MFDMRDISPEVTQQILGVFFNSIFATKQVDMFAQYVLLSTGKWQKQAQHLFRILVLEIVIAELGVFYPGRLKTGIRSIQDTRHYEVG